MAEIDHFSKRRIFQHAETALRAAGAVDINPTPLDDVAAAAGTREVVDISQLPDDLSATKPRRWKRILGAYLFRTETIFLDGDQPTGRRRFTEAHEIGHRILPWQRAAHYLDDDIQLFQRANDQFEREASLAGAYLIFQGARFHQRALDYVDSLQTPLLLANDHDASLHATIRFYAEHHPEPMALATAGMFLRQNGSVPLWTTAESQAFAARYGSLSEWLPNDSIVVAASEASEVGTLVEQARTSNGIHEDTVAITHPTRGATIFQVETFSNQRTVFVLVRPHRRIRLGKRLRTQTG